MSIIKIRRFASPILALVFISTCCGTELTLPYIDQFIAGLKNPGEGQPAAEQVQEGAPSQAEQAGEADAPQPEAPQPQGPFTEFSLDSCSCAGLGLPLSEDRSYFANNTHPMGMVTGGEVMVTNNLTCNYEEAYKSEHKTATISANMNLYRFDEPQYAQAAYIEYSNDIKDDPGWCEADESCTVTAAEDADMRAFYAEETYYSKGSSTEKLPSTHRANVVRLFDTGDGYFVLQLFVTHPELLLGDPWVMNKALALEACAAALVGE